MSNTAQLQATNANIEMYNSELLNNVTGRLQAEGKLPTKYNATAGK